MGWTWAPTLGLSWGWGWGPAWVVAAWWLSCLRWGMGMGVGHKARAKSLGIDQKRADVRNAIADTATSILVVAIDYAKARQGTIAWPRRAHA